MARVILDLATSGTNPMKHAILEIALIKVDNSFNELGNLFLKIRHEDLVVSPEALAYNGMDLRDAVNWTAAASAADSICGFLTGYGVKPIWDGTARISKSNLVGLGVAKDCQFLEAFLSSTLYNKLFFPRISDIGTTFENCLDMGLVPHPRGNNLHEIARAAGVDVPEQGEHSSVADAKMALATARNLFLLMKEAGQRMRGEPVCATF
jgi:DNA polymerase III epsilon subunit-like protein